MIINVLLGSNLAEKMNDDNQKYCSFALNDHHSRRNGRKGGRRRRERRRKKKRRRKNGLVSNFSFGSAYQKRKTASMSRFCQPVIQA